MTKGASRAPSAHAFRSHAHYLGVMTTMRKRVLALARGRYSLVVPQRHVNDAALVGGHRPQSHGDVLTRCTIRGPACDVLDLLATAMPIALDIHDDRVSEPELAGS